MERERGGEGQEEKLMYREQQKKTIKLTLQAVIPLVKKYNAAITHGTISIATK